MGRELRENKSLLQKLPHNRRPNRVAFWVNVQILFHENVGFRFAIDALQTPP